MIPGLEASACQGMAKKKKERERKKKKSVAPEEENSYLWSVMDLQRGFGFRQRFWDLGI